MRLLAFIASLLLAGVAPAAAPRAPRCAVEVLPAVGIGGIEVGATVASHRARGIDLVTDGRFSGMKRYKDLLILLSPDGERVQTVELSRERFGRCARVGDVALTARMTLEAMAARLGRCGPLDMRSGGTIVQCGDGLELRDSAAGVGILVAADDASSSPETVCKTYVASGATGFAIHRAAGDETVKKSRGAALEVAREGPICHGAQVYTPAVRKERYKYEYCTAVPHPGFQQLNCGDIGYRFDVDGALRELLLFPYALGAR